MSDLLQQDGRGKPLLPYIFYSRSIRYSRDIKSVRITARLE